MYLSETVLDSADIWLTNLNGSYGFRRDVTSMKSSAKLWRIVALLWYIFKSLAKKGGPFLSTGAAFWQPTTGSLGGRLAPTVTTGKKKSPPTKARSADCKTPYFTTHMCSIVYCTVLSRTTKLVWEKKYFHAILCCLQNLREKIKCKWIMNTH